MKHDNRSIMSNSKKPQNLATMKQSTERSQQSEVSSINLYLAAMTANLGATAAGCALTWSSPTLIKLVNGGDPSISLVITKEEATWVGSLVTLGAAVGPILSGFILDKLGRKNTVLFSMILSIMAWIVIGFIPKINVLCLARFILGISVGLVFTAVPTYIAEISTPNLRSSLGTLMQFFLCCGFLIEYTVGPYTSYLTLALVSLIAPVLCFATFMWMPNSPHSILNKPGREEEASRALCWFRGTSQESAIAKELQEIILSIEEAKKQKSGFYELFANKGNIKAVMISLTMVGLQQMSGINIVLLYSENIFKAANTNLTASTCTIIVGVVMLVTCSFTPTMANYMSMKKMLNISAIGMFFSEVALGFYFFCPKLGMDQSSLQWLPIASLVTYIIAFYVGYGPLPWAIMGEVFPANLKSIATSITASVCWFLGFLLCKNFNTMSAVFGMDYVFWLFGSFCIVALMFTVFVLPDTEGKTLQEIQDMLHGRTKRSINDNVIDKTDCLTRINLLSQAE
ncbi:facilitated trehalose transporter Tret1-like isoform X1 [Daktulosphaira vitifoliae]|uniref:facilitated trehalose transporter Tret1-like isoform X1 n=1 Tax=Daktulosphaira vitifoliae TaxID=58002 RepID=UPI0021AA6239|nr:facilitated trehalose transporter Tret1-like isoform X1 [Daktulosphaira vitifoliae]XP_050534177.1 facilitated trehalose transporter Tret1-like isoform X1 [Daktulosphaira vitifoliae]